MSPRVLVAGHAGTPTGYARVLEEILPRLTPAFDFTLFALNARDPVPESSLPGLRVVPNVILGDPYGREQFPALLDETDPDVVFVHHDLYLFSVLEEGLAAHRALRPHVRTVVYCPIEWESTRPGNVRTLLGADLVVTYTGFGARTIERAFEGCAMRPEVATVGHGIDTETFHPVSGARRALFPDRPELDDAFVVLNANRNVPRKKIGLTVEAFAEFADDKDDAYLLLHTGLRDKGVDVRALAAALGIEDRLLLTNLDDAPPRMSDEELNLVYNAADVGLNTATGEGWGLVAFEHGATGAAQVLPDHTACRELWQDKALLVRVEEGREDDGIVSRDGVVAALEALYAEPALRARLGEAARRHAHDPRFTWDSIAGRWHKLLSNLLPDSSNPLPDGVKPA